MVGFTKCARAKWELPSYAVAGIWGTLLVFYILIMVNVNSRANKALKSSLLTGFFFALATVPIYYVSARLAAVWLPIVILAAFDSQLKLTQAGFKSQSNMFSVYIAWLFYVLAITGYVAVTCPPVTVIENQMENQIV
jgi:hypothetical protein